MLTRKAYIDPIKIRDAKIAGTIRFFVKGNHIICTDGTCDVYVGEIKEEETK